MAKAVSVVIPTYQARHLLEANLPQVISQLRKFDELIVIEDAGNDDTASWLEKTIRRQVEKRGATLKIIVNQKNLRFGASCNKAVKLAKNDHIFLLNNDVSPHDHCLIELLKHFDDNQVFGVGCLEMEKSGEKHGKNKLWFERGMFMHAKSEPMTSGETAWVIGGSGMFDRKKWLKLGGFDERFYPAYWEDIDLSFAARKHGWKVLFEEKAKVDHNHESTNKDVFGDQRVTEMSWNNASKFAWKNGDFWQKVLFIIWQPYWFYKRYIA